MISVVIVDDHSVVSSGLAELLDMDGEFSVLGTCASGEEAVTFVKRKGLGDILLLDMRLPDMTGLDLFQRIRKFEPQAKAVFLVGMPLGEEETRAKELGAAGYLSKAIAMDDLVAHLKALVAGRESFASQARQSANGQNPFSPRVTQVLQLLANGYTREQVAARLGISLETVKTHARQILETLDAVNMIQAAMKAVKLGIISV